MQDTVQAQRWDQWPHHYVIISHLPITPYLFILAAKAYEDSKRVQWSVYILHKVQNKQPYGSDLKKIYRFWCESSLRLTIKSANNSVSINVSLNVNDLSMNPQCGCKQIPNLPNPGFTCKNKFKTTKFSIAFKISQSLHTHSYTDGIFIIQLFVNDMSKLHWIPCMASLCVWVRLIVLRRGTEHQPWVHLQMF